jgi:hypothetical protein
VRLRNAALIVALVPAGSLGSACSLEEFAAELGQPTSTAGAGAAASGAGGQGGSSGGSGAAGSGGWSIGGGGANHALVIDPNNVAIHPSFEDSTEPWLQEAMDGAATPLHIQLDDAPHGIFVAQAVETKASTDYFHLWDNRTAVPSTAAGQRYTASVFARAADPSSKGKPARLYIREWDGREDLCLWTTAELPLDDVEWRRFEVSAVAIHDGLELDVTFAQNGSAEGNSYYLDLFQVIADPEQAQAPPADCAAAGGTSF